MAEVKRGSPFLTRVGIAVYAIVCLAFFISLMFPYDHFRGRLERSIGTAVDRDVTLGRVHARFPFGFKADGMSIDKNPLAEELIIKPHLLSLLAGKKGMDIKAVFPSGSLLCSYDKTMGAQRKTVHISLKMDNLDSSVFHALLPTAGKPKGLITGTIELSGPESSLKDMDGNASITWKDGFIPLPGTNLPVSGLKFKTLEVASRMESGVLNLERVDFAGDMSGNVKGSVRMMDPVGRSRLNLTGEISLSKESGTDPSSDGMRFSLRGSIDRPGFRILGFPR